MKRILYKQRLDQRKECCMALPQPRIAPELTVSSTELLIQATSRSTVKLSILWLTRQKIGCSLPLFATHTTFSARSYPPILTRWPGLRKRAHPFTLPLKDDKQCIPRVLYRALLPPVQSQVYFPHWFFYTPYTLSTTIISISLSLHLVLLAPVNSCELHNYYLVLSFLLTYSSSGLSTDVFSNKTNINTHWISRS